MPNIGIHLLLGARVLRRWTAQPASAPFPVHDARTVNAFFYGAISPDAGYFPRSDRLFSELAHLTRTSDLTRALLDEADTPAQRAYAWGWVTHVLGDLAIHPLINAAHGERIHGDRARPVLSTDDQIGHMRLEYGLDSAMFDAFPEVARVRLGDVPHERDLSHIARAYRRTFAWAPVERWIGDAHRMCGRMARMCHVVNRTFNARMRRDPVRGLVRHGAAWIAPPRWWLPDRWNHSPVAQAVLAQLPPPAWLLQQASEVVEGFGAWLDELRSDNLSHLPNHDLISGALETPETPGHRTADALRTLAVRGGR